MGHPLVETVALKKYFSTSKGFLHAVDNVNIRIEQGHTLGVVGESGCGKSTLGRTILRLIEPTSGDILFDGKSITGLDKKQMKSLREEMQLIFQDPFSSLNPRMTICETIAEPMKLAGLYKSKNERLERVFELKIGRAHV